MGRIGTVRSNIFSGSIRYLYLANLIFAACAGVPASDVSLSASPVRPIITAGEPLFVKVVIENVSSARVLLRTDADVLSRTTTGPGGSQVKWVEPPPVGDFGYFFKELAPGLKESVILVATETAGL